MRKSIKAVSFYLVAALSLGVASNASAGQCWKKMGPYYNNYGAEQDRYQYQSRGFATSGVWGEGGVVSQWSNRRYFFKIFYRC